MGLIGPRLVNPDGSLQRSAYGYPSGADTILGESGLHLVIRRIPWLRERFLRTWSHTEPRRVPWVLGAALAIRRSAFDQVGGFDAGYFMYAEERDLCRRLEIAGFETHYAPVTTVVHAGAASTRQQAAAMRRQSVISRRRYLLRYESPRLTDRVLEILRAITVARLIRDVLHLRLVRDGEERARLRQSAAASKALVKDRGLWKP